MATLSCSKKLTSILLDAKSHLRLAPSLESLGQTAYDLCASMMMTMFGGYSCTAINTRFLTSDTHLNERTSVFTF